MKKVSILGSTGSIGKQTLEVISAFKDDFEVVGLAAGSNTQLLIEQINEYKPRFVSVKDTALAQEIKQYINDPKVEVFYGDTGLEFISSCRCDIVVNSLVGAMGLKPTISALASGKRVAFANKETLVVAGELIKKLLKEGHGEVIPLDSEHVAIHQCLHRDTINCVPDVVKRLILTASGGPFRKKSKEEIEKATKEEALKHPTWVMGPKITIDCATLMNKGLEVIEAMNLFDISQDKIDVLIHPQSVMHSAVEFIDGNIIAQLGTTDMRLPIQYSLFYPEKKALPFDLCCDLLSVGKLEFEQPDFERFPCLKLAYEAAQKGGSYPVVLNAANEVAVSLFLEDKIKFTDIPKLISESMEKHSSSSPKTLEEILEIDCEVRYKTAELIKVLR